MTLNRLRRLVAKVSLVAAACAAAGGALAQNVTQFFELDGNVAQNGATLKNGGKDDWATVNANPPTNSSAKARTGVQADKAPVSIFTGGGSKDDLDVSGWRFKNGAVPDKDDITNAYAAAYNINGKLYIYAGADRFDNSGDAFIGFWFFQNQVTLATGTPGGNGLPFIGNHAVGDLLVLANFTGGGTTVTIEILRWVGSGGSVNGTLERVLVGGQPVVSARCGDAGTPATVCAITNGGLPAETPPWPYQAKDGSTAFIQAGFFELGISISDLLGSTPCFASFMAETRSSSSVSAQLKDFSLHDLPVCGIAVSKSCNVGQFNAATQDFTFTIAGQVLNNGFGQLNSIALTDDPVIPAASFSYFKCDANKLPDETQPPVAFAGLLAGGADVCYKASFTTSANAPSDAITVNAKSGTTAIPPATAGATCPNINVPSVVTVSKQCDTILEADATRLFVAVNIKGQVCNTGSSNLSNVSVTDPFITSGGSLVNLVGATSLTPGACKEYTSKYYPNASNPAANRLAPSSSTPIAGLAQFKDEVTANATSAFGTVTPAKQTATCNLCPTCLNPDACSLNTQGVYVCKATN
jgi:hypothetical protein